MASSSDEPLCNNSQEKTKMGKKSAFWLDWIESSQGLHHLVWQVKRWAVLAFLFTQQHIVTMHILVLYHRITSLFYFISLHKSKVELIGWLFVLSKLSDMISSLILIITKSCTFCYLVWNYSLFLFVLRKKGDKCLCDHIILQTLSQLIFYLFLIELKKTPCHWT